MHRGSPSSHQTVFFKPEGGGRKQGRIRLDVGHALTNAYDHEPCTDRKGGGLSNTDTDKPEINYVAQLVLGIRPHRQMHNSIGVVA